MVMNIDNLNNNNQNNLQGGIEPNIAPVEPNFGVPPVSNPGPGGDSGSALGSEPVATPVAQPMNSINLAPEGIVDTTPVVEPPSPLMGATLTPNTPLNGDQPMPNEPINNPSLNANNTISENPSMFGGVPTPTNSPVMDDSALPSRPTKKKGGKKVLVIVLVALLIVGIGGGVYYFLNVANNPVVSVTISPKITNWQLGKKLSTNPSDYADITGIDASSCTVDTSKMNIKKAGSYEYTVTCPGADAVTSGVEVLDEEGPMVTLKDVIVKPGTEVSLLDFISKCEDVSLDDECDVALDDDTIKLEELINKTGTYKIPLVIADKYDNKTKVEATLKVDENAPSQFLNCEVANPLETETKARVQEVYEYSLNDNNEVVIVTRDINYLFDNQEDYEQVKSAYETSSKIDNLAGIATFDDDNLKVNYRVDVDPSDLKDALKVDSDLKTYDDVVFYHEGAGDLCSLP